MAPAPPVHPCYFDSIRAHRQRILHRDETPVALHAIVHEAGLHQGLQDPKVLNQQLEHLCELAELPTITMQVLPLAATHPALTGAFTVVSTGQLDWVHVELLTSDVYLETPESVRPYLAGFEVMSQRALTPEESRSLLSERIALLQT